MAGKPAIWNGQSPILFPIIGKLLNDRCVIGGKTYEIIRHGLARHRAFQCVEQTDDKLVFLQKENEDTLLHYPYRYELYITFSLDGNRLTVTHTVKNTNDCTMYFSLGAHPALTAPSATSWCLKSRKHFIVSASTTIRSSPAKKI